MGSFLADCLSLATLMADFKISRQLEMVVFEVSLPQLVMLFWLGCYSQVVACYRRVLRSKVLLSSTEPQLLISSETLELLSYTRPINGVTQNL